MPEGAALLLGLLKKLAKLAGIDTHARPLTSTEASEYNEAAEKLVIRLAGTLDSTVTRLTADGTPALVWAEQVADPERRAVVVDFILARATRTGWLAELVRRAALVRASLGIGDILVAGAYGSARHWHEHGGRKHPLRAFAAQLGAVSMPRRTFLFPFGARQPRPTQPMEPMQPMGQTP